MVAASARAVCVQYEKCCDYTLDCHGIAGGCPQPRKGYSGCGADTHGKSLQISKHISPHYHGWCSENEKHTRHQLPMGWWRVVITKAQHYYYFFCSSQKTSHARWYTLLGTRYHSVNSFEVSSSVASTYTNPSFSNNRNSQHCSMS